VTIALALSFSVLSPLEREANAGTTFITFLATGGEFTCNIALINFFGNPVRMTIDTAIATNRTNTTVTQDFLGFDGRIINCNGLTGGAPGVSFLSVFVSQANSLPPQAFGFMVVPASLGGGIVVPAHMFLFS
jgi:hypothetical protein